MKMSKSDKSKKACINIIDDPEMIRIKISKAKTDAIGRVRSNYIILLQIKYDESRPELLNLLSIYAAIEGIDVKKVDQLFD